MLGFNHDKEVLDRVREVIENAPRIVFHNAKFDLVSLMTLKINFTGEFYDTALMAYLINENWPYSKKLGELTKSYIGPEVHKEMSPWLREYINTFGWGMVPSEYMYSYATTDAHITLLLLKALWNKYHQESTAEIWVHKQKLTRVVMRMEKHGVKVDVEHCQWLIDQGEQVLAEIFEFLDFNAMSSKQKEKFFIQEMGLPVLKYTDKGMASFTKDVMPEYERMLEDHFPGDERVQKILTYMGWKQSIGLFYRPWIELCSPDGRLRTNYRIYKDDDGGTTTGRLSSQKPNLQQIPKVTNKEWNKEVKFCLIAEEGYILIEADYAQLELRLAVAYAGEEGLKKVFNEDRDIFEEMSVQLNMTRDNTKTFVYSTQYGAGNNRISTVFNISMAQAQKIRNTYFETYRGFARFAEECRAKALHNRRVRIWSGRYRHFTRDVENEAHKAMNSVIQGGAADIVERIMVKCDETFVNDNECRMLLQIHDALIFEVRLDKLDYYLQQIKSTMESVNEIKDFGVKFAVDIHVLGSKKKLL